MATKNLELSKTKMVDKLWEVRHDVTTSKTQNRFDKTIKRSKILEKRYIIVVKQSKKGLVIGKNIKDEKFFGLKNVYIDDIEL